MGRRVGVVVMDVTCWWLLREGKKEISILFSIPYSPNARAPAYPSNSSQRSQLAKARSLFQETRPASFSVLVPPRP